MITTIIELLETNPQEAVALIIAAISSAIPIILAGAVIARKIVKVFNVCKSLIETKQQEAEDSVSAITDEKIAGVLKENSELREFVTTLTAANLALRNIPDETKKELVDQLKEIIGVVLTIPTMADKTIGEIENIDIEAMLEGGEDDSTQA